MDAREVPVVLGLNPFESPFDIYLRLKYNIKRESPEITASKQLRPLIRDLFLEKNPDYKIVQVHALTKKGSRRDRTKLVACPVGLPCRPSSCPDEKGIEGG